MLCINDDWHSVYENPLFSNDNKKKYGSKGWQHETYEDDDADDLHFTEDDEKMFEGSYKN